MLLVQLFYASLKGPFCTSRQNWNYPNKIKGQILSWQVFVLSVASTLKISNPSNSISACLSIRLASIVAKGFHLQFPGFIPSPIKTLESPSFAEKDNFCLCSKLNSVQKLQLKYRQPIWEKLHHTCFNNSPIIKTFEVVPSPVISSYEKKEKTDDQIKTQIYLGSLWNVMSWWQIKWSCFNHRLKLNKNWEKN